MSCAVVQTNYPDPRGLDRCFGPPIALWDCAFPGCGAEIRWGRDNWYHAWGIPSVLPHEAYPPAGVTPDMPAPER